MTHPAETPRETPKEVMTTVKTKDSVYSDKLLKIAGGISIEKDTDVLIDSKNDTHILMKIDKTKITVGDDSVHGSIINEYKGQLLNSDYEKKQLNNILN